MPVVNHSGVLQDIFATGDFVEWAQDQLVQLARVFQQSLQRERRDRPTSL